MTQTEFQEPFEDVAVAFSKKTDEKLCAVYQEKFVHLSGKQWAGLCDWATLNCDRFPTIKDLYRGMYELNMVERPRASDLDKDTYVVVCVCGSSFAVARHSEHPVVKCPAVDCHVSYDMPYILHNADQYNVLWADPDMVAALRTRISPKEALKQIAALVSRMEEDQKTFVHADGISQRMKRDTASLLTSLAQGKKVD